MYLCLCKTITESDVKRLARYGTTTPEALKAEGLIATLGLNDDDCCGRCLLEIDQFVAVAAREWLRMHETPGV